MAKFISHIYRVFLVSIFSFSIFASPAQSQEFELPSEELAKESVLPVFDKTVVVRNRAVTTAQRFEVNGYAGLNLLEPFYSNMVMGFGGTYHFTETHGVNVTAMMLGSSLSSNAKALQNGEGLPPGQSFDASRAPTVESILFGNYQMTAYYGKISVTKQRAMNLSLYGLAGLGIVNWSDKVEPALNVGFGQKLYFTPNWALRADLNLAMYNGPDTASKQGLTTGGPTLGSGDFSKTMYFRSFLTAGIAYLF